MLEPFTGVNVGQGVLRFLVHVNENKRITLYELMKKEEEEEKNAVERSKPVVISITENLTIVI